jgi:Flp pilus assembly protein TadD
VDLGFDQIREGAIDDAESALRKGLAVSPEDLRVHYLLGIVDEVRGRKTEAIAEFLQAESSSDPAIAQSARANVSDLKKSANPSAGPN